MVDVAALSFVSEQRDFASEKSGMPDKVKKRRWTISLFGGGKIDAQKMPAQNAANILAGQLDVIVSCWLPRRPCKRGAGDLFAL